RKVTKNGDIWQVWIGDEQEPRLYRGLVIANGHHTQPTKPDVPGSFDGEVLHSNDYKGPEQFRDKKVLVVGAGNSGLDLSCDAALYGGESFHSLRRGYHIIPKVIFGRPTDVVFEKLKRLKLPKWMVRSVAAMVMKTIIGPYEKYGLPKPDGEFFEHHPTCSSRYLDLLRHGRINIRPDVKNVEGRTVTFEDGRTQDVDMIVYATGYKVSLPFFDPQISDDLLDLKNLFINLFHRNDDSLFFVGLFQPADGGFWQLADYQSRLMTRFIQSCDKGEKCADNFRKVKAKEFYDIGHGNKYVESDRHKYEVDHYRYRQVVGKLMKIFPGLSEANPIAQTSADGEKQPSTEAA
ncbi:MAG: flavin-containing monooxygenase, partial [Methyloligellaceae bacterium]